MSSESDHNHFSTDTPDADSWQQYACTAPGCPAKQRVAIPPSVAPVSLYRVCRGCESRQRHVADGGSGCIDMIDLTTNPDVAPAAVLGSLRAGHAVRTPVRETGDPDSPLVHLSRDDGLCTRCGDLIEPDSFGDGAPFFRILAQQRRKHGSTYCEGCLSEVGE